MCYNLKAKKKKSIRASQGSFPGNITEVCKNPPQRFVVLSLPGHCHGWPSGSQPSVASPILVLHREPGLALAVTLSPGCKHGAYPRLLWALIDASGLMEDRANCQDQRLNQMRSDSKERQEEWSSCFMPSPLKYVSTFN